jgi:hypothetical protein
MLVCAAKELPQVRKGIPVEMVDGDSVQEELRMFEKQFEREAKAVEASPELQRRLAQAAEKEKELVMAQAIGDADIAARAVARSRHLMQVVTAALDGGGFGCVQPLKISFCVQLTLASGGCSAL